MEANTLCNRLGPDRAMWKKMLEKMKKVCTASDELINPRLFRLTFVSKEPIELPEPLTEYTYGKHMAELAAKNKLYATYIGMG